MHLRHGFRKLNTVSGRCLIGGWNNVWFVGGNEAHYLASNNKPYLQQTVQPHLQYARHATQEIEMGQMDQHPPPYQVIQQPQMQMQIPGAMGGNPFMQMQPQPQPQMMTGFQPQPQFAGPSPGMFMQQQQPQQQMFGQTNPFGGAGWQQTGFPGQQQQWGGGM